MLRNEAFLVTLKHIRDNAFLQTWLFVQAEFTHRVRNVSKIQTRNPVKYKVWAFVSQEHMMTQSSAFVPDGQSALFLTTVFRQVRGKG